MRSLFALDYETLRSVIAADGLSPVHARTLWRTLYRRSREDLQQMRDFLPPLQRWSAAHLEQDWHAQMPKIVTHTSSSDGQTQKLLLELHDATRIETVVMGYTGRYTACISTQVGCAMGCVFCATGQGGFTRHLTADEIVSQVLHARHNLASRGLSGLRNLVLMGMGEPLHNYDAVMQALSIITDSRGLNLGAAKISISTVGLVPGIRRLADENQPYNLALSLHASTDEQRNKLIPVNRRWPLAELMAACRYYGEKTGRRIFVEWTLIRGENDSEAEATRLAQLLRGMDVHINLIPLNLTQGYQGQPTDLLYADAFQAILQAEGYPCTIRQRRGIDVDAGCGQLASRVG
jgi:23S rRNA (adenine2503-C2)-methyltransferase